MDSQSSPQVEDKKILGVNRNVFFLGLVSFFNDFSSEMVQSVMPVFLTSVLGAPAFFVGLIEGVADALASVLKLFSGWFSDRINKRKLPAVIGYVISTVIRPFFALAGNAWGVLFLRAVDRVGKGFRTAPRDALIIESSTREELGRSFGLHRTMDTIGAICGPLIAFVVLGLVHYSYPRFFLIAFFIGIGALVSFVFVREKKKGGIEAPVQKPKLNIELFRTHKTFVLITLSLFVFGMGSLPILLVLLRAQELGVPIHALPLVYFLYNFAFVLFAIPLGRWADRIGERFVIALGFVAAAAAYFGLAAINTLILGLLCFVVLGIYSAATDGLTRSLAGRYLENHILATGQGFLNMATGFSSLFAGVIGGILWTRFNSSAALIYAGIFSLIGFFLFLCIVSRKRSDTPLTN